MSKKPEKKIERAPRYFDTTQDEFGREILNPVSLVATVDMRPLTIGERIARYSGPSPRELELAGYGYDDDGFDDDFESDTPLSEYEDRTIDIAVRAKANRENRINKEAEETKAREAAHLEKLSQELEELRKKASATPIPATPAKAADSPPKG